MLRIFGHYIPRSVLTLVTGDIILLMGSVYAGRIPPYLGLPSIWLGYEPILPKALVMGGMTLVVLYLGDMYTMSKKLERTEVIARTAACLLAVSLLVGTLNFVLLDLRLSRLAYTLSLFLSFVFLAGFRLIYLDIARGQLLQERIVFLGASAAAYKVLDEVNSGHDLRCEVIGCVADQSPEREYVSEVLRYLGRSTDLKRIAVENKADTIVIALSERRQMLPIKEILDCKMRGIRVEDWPNFYERLTGKIAVQHLRPSWLIFSDGFNRTRFTETIKRIIDVTLSSALLLLGLPVTAIVSVLIKVDSRGPVFFRQERVRQGGRPFSLIKFRTMTETAEEDTGPIWAQEDDPRITRVGKVLRKIRLDEAPQIINVLRGEMSFVGPRPERPFFVAQLQEVVPFYAQRLVVKPGITGWAQVNYRYGSSVEDTLEKLQYDLYYIKNMSLFLDFLIIVRTVQAVLFGRGSR